jgi:hypothetical protein
MATAAKAFFVANSRTFVKLILGLNLTQGPTARSEAPLGDQFSRQTLDYE